MVDFTKYFVVVQPLRLKILNICPRGKVRSRITGTVLEVSHHWHGGKNLVHWHGGKNLVSLASW